MNNMEDFVIENGILKKYVGPGGNVKIPESVHEIGERAFCRCSSLTCIELPESVAAIGSYAFACCSSLETVTVPERLGGIGEGAFKSCGNLTNINIPNGITIIERETFAFCDKLKDITIPESVVKIEEEAFFACRSLETVTIPERVESMGEGAFKSCENLTSVTIPDGVDALEDYIFSGCRSLKNIKIPESVTEIGKSAFDGCWSLTSITLPESIAKIGCYAFSCCSELRTIIIPASVNEIGLDAFSHCRELEKISVDSRNVNYTSYEDCLYNKDMSELIIFPLKRQAEEYVIPEGVVKIGELAFLGCHSLTRVVIPESVKEIGKAAFADCENLVDLVIPEKVAKIGKDAFTACKKLVLHFKGCLIENLELNYELEYIDASEEMMAKIMPNRDAKLNLCKVYLGKDVTNHVYEKWCKSIKKALIEWAIHKDDAVAMAKLLSIAKPANLGDLDECMAKAQGKTNVTAYLLDYKTRNYSEEQVEKHESDKVDKELGLKDKTLGEWRKIFRIGERANGYAILGYKGTDANLIIPATIDKRSVIEIGDKAFKNREDITDVTIAEGIVKIGNYAFYGCRNLKSITIPESIEDIGISVFFRCKEMTIYAKAKSYAYRYAKEKRIPVVTE